MVDWWVELSSYVASGEGVGTVLVTLFGVGAAEWLALQARRRDDANAAEAARIVEKTNRETVCNAVANGAALALLGVWRHKASLDVFGVPVAGPILSGFHKLDPFRASQALGREVYSLLLESGAMADLTNEWISRKNSEHVAAINTASLLAPTGFDSTRFAEAFYRDTLPSTTRQFEIVESSLCRLIAAIDEPRMQRLWFHDRLVLRADIERLASLNDRQFGENWRV